MATARALTFDAAEVADRIVAWLRERAREAGAQGAIFGLSGGIDSATVGALCRRAFPDKQGVLGLIMPCHSRLEDAEHARLAAEAFGIPTRTVDLSAAYDALLAQFSPWRDEAARRRVAEANLKPRLRMATLYFHANLYNYLVAGTGNLSELTVGYFTKYGDGGVDLLPLGNMVKSEVRELARHLGVPRPIIDRPPTAGLWEGQTDEGEMGLTYEALDRYIRTGEGPPDVVSRVLAMSRATVHKRRMPPAFEVHPDEADEDVAIADDEDAGGGR